MHRFDHRVGAVAQPQVGEHAHGQHRQQLDHRFEGDRQHHAVMVFGGIDLAGTEQGGEQRHQQRHVQRGIGEEAGRAGVAGQHLQAHRHRFVLQGQVRNDADQRDDRHQCRQPPRAAEARRDEVGDGHHVLAACDQRQALDDAPAEQQQQQRTDIDRQVAHAVAHGGTDRTVERPRRAVHGQRQAVDHRPQPRPVGVHRPTVTPPRHAEQQRGIGNRDQQQDPAGDHARVSVRTGASRSRPLVVRVGHGGGSWRWVTTVGRDGGIHAHQRWAPTKGGAHPPGTGLIPPARPFPSAVPAPGRPWPAASAGSACPRARRACSAGRTTSWR